MRIEQNRQRGLLEKLLGMVQELGTSTASDLGSLSIPDSMSIPLTSVEEVEAAEKELEQPTVFTNMVSKSRFSRLCCSFDSH